MLIIGLVWFAACRATVAGELLNFGSCFFGVGGGVLQLGKVGGEVNFSFFAAKAKPKAGKLNIAGELVFVVVLVGELVVSGHVGRV